VEPLAGLNLSYVRTVLKRAKKGKEAYMNERTQVVEIMSISSGMKAQTRENF
jgi:hypothetical protein